MTDDKKKCQNGPGDNENNTGNPLTGMLDAAVGAVWRSVKGAARGMIEGLDSVTSALENGTSMVGDMLSEAGIQDMEARVPVPELPVTVTQTPEPVRKTDASWQNARATVLIAAKLFGGGEVPKNLEPGAEASYEQVAPALAACAEVCRRSRRAETDLQRADVILRNYYREGQIADNIGYLTEVMAEDVPDDSEADLYARELYQYSIKQVRGMFDLAEEQLRTMPGAEQETQAGPEADTLSGRAMQYLALLKTLGPDDSYLAAAIPAAEAAIPLYQRIRERLRADGTPDRNDPDLADFMQYAERLAAALLDERHRLTGERIGCLLDFLRSVTVQQEARIADMQAEIDRGLVLHEELRQILHSPEAEVMLATMDPRKNDLSGMTAQEIHQRYEPLAAALNGLAQRFPKK